MSLDKRSHNVIKFHIKLYIAVFIITLISTTYLFYNLNQKVYDLLGKTIEEEVFILENKLQYEYDSDKQIIKNIEILFKEIKDIEKIKQIFLSIMQTNKDFMQLRYIDKSGKEIIRVDRRLGEEPFIVNDSLLQDKSNRDYFLSKDNQIKENIWFSNLDLNVENNKIEIPYNPTIRIVLPYFENDDFNGIFVINKFVSKSLETNLDFHFFNAFLINDQGKVLFNTNANSEIESFINFKKNIKEYFPYNYQNILNNQTYKNKEILSKKLDLNLPNKLFLVLQINQIELKKIQENFFLKSIIVTLFLFGLIYFFHMRQLIRLDFQISKYIRFLNLKSKLIKEKNKELKVLRKHEKRLIDTKEEVLTNISHNIRTPLNGIIGVVNILLDNIKDNLNRSYLEMILNSSNSLKNFTENFLNSTKIENNSLIVSKKGFNLESICEDVFNFFLIKIAKNELIYDVIIDNKIPKLLIGDDFKLKQILINIIDNSLNFTKEGYINLEIKLLKIENNDIKIRFIIEDSGTGIEEKILLNIKETLKFHDKEILLSNKKSLGLFISNKLIKILNGKLDIESIENKGTKVFFDLDFKIASKSENLITSEIDKKVTKLKYTKKALIVDDNEINLVVTKNILSKLGFSSFTTTNGLNAIKLIEEKEFDVVLMDIQMPIIDGFRTASKIREFDKEIPIIFLSATINEDEIEKFRALGVDYYLEKPFNIMDLYKILLNYFEFDKEKEFNFENTCNSLGLEKEIILELLKDFVDMYKNFDIELAQLDINSNEFNSKIHKLKGAAASLQILNIASICGNILKCSNTYEKEKLIKELKNNLKEISKSINNLIVY